MNDNNSFSPSFVKSNYRLGSFSVTSALQQFPSAREQIIFLTHFQTLRCVHLFVGGGGRGIFFIRTSPLHFALLNGANYSANVSIDRRFLPFLVPSLNNIITRDVPPPFVLFGLSLIHI